MTMHPIRGRAHRLALATAAGLVATTTLAGAALAGDGDGLFRRVASFPVFLNTDIAEETVSEIISANDAGTLIAYTDGALEKIGFVDITNPDAPAADGTVDVAGEPTSCAFLGDDYVLASSNTSVDFVNTSGVLEVIDVATRTIVATIDLGGQPDSIAISPDQQYAAVCIENERDEDLGNGKPPQLPAGFLVIVDLVGTPDTWTTRTVDLTGVADLFPEDPEPEFCDINDQNVAAVSLQENNHIVLVDLVTGTVTGDFSCGTVDLTDVDVVENDLIEQDATLTAVPREPDAIAWVGDLIGTANEGDLFGGSRGWSLFQTDGTVVFDTGNAFEHLGARIGHYNENRSENKGTEPESIEFGIYDGVPHIFVGSERSSFVAVYRGNGPDAEPTFLQALPTGLGPEGLLTVPQADLFVVCSEEDARDDKFRSQVSIYRRGMMPNYPTITSSDRSSGVPIPWAALSGLSVDPMDDGVAYTVHDSFYQRSRVYAMDVSTVPATITDEIEINDGGGVLAAAIADLAANLTDPGDLDASAIINGDGSVNIDPEGVVATTAGTFWVASEGSGNLVGGVSDPDDRPFTTPNLVLEIAADGTILRAVLPPLELTRNQLRFGFEGVTIDESADALYVCWQREWSAAGDPSGNVRIGRYDLGTESWTFAYYPIETPSSPVGGWVGLSDITLLADGRLAVQERDNQGGPDARVKLVTVVDPASVAFAANSATPDVDFDVLVKQIVRDHLAAGDFDATGGLVPEKIEGLMVTSTGDVWIVNDNDGVDDNSGETQLLNLGGLLATCVGDLDGDGSVGFADLVGLLAAWGDCDGCAADLDGNGTVDASDLFLVLASYGPCPG